MSQEWKSALKFSSQLLNLDVFEKQRLWVNLIVPELIYTNRTKRTIIHRLGLETPFGESGWEKNHEKKQTLENTLQVLNV